MKLSLLISLCVLTEANAAVLQQVAEVVEHGALVLTADPAEVAQEATAVGHHLGEPDLLQNGGIQDSESVFALLPKWAGSYTAQVKKHGFKVQLLVKFRNSYFVSR